MCFFHQSRAKRMSANEKTAISMEGTLNSRDRSSTNSEEIPERFVAGGQGIHKCPPPLTL
jgi:hypothetical protein